MPPTTPIVDRRLAGIRAHVDAAALDARIEALSLISESPPPAVTRVLFMARISPTTMIFIPCRNGWSHRPEEYASSEAIAAGVAVLAEALRRLAGPTR